MHARLLCSCCCLTYTQPCAPLQRYIFMKLLYHDTTPEAYEPPGFKGHDCVAHFPRQPFAMYAL